MYKLTMYKLTMYKITIITITKITIYRITISKITIYNLTIYNLDWSLLGLIKAFGVPCPQFSDPIVFHSSPFLCGPVGVVL